MRQIIDPVDRMKVFMQVAHIKQLAVDVLVGGTSDEEHEWKRYLLREVTRLEIELTELLEE